MSQEMRNEQSGRKDINRAATASDQRQDYEGFEGMNYEQVRQPYNPTHKGRNSRNEKRNDGKRPDEC